MRLPFSRKPKPWDLKREALADLKALVQQPGYKVWLELLERAAVSDTADLGQRGTSDMETYAASQRWYVWQRCHSFLETIIAGQEAVDDFAYERRNGGVPTPDRAKHWGTPAFWR